MSNKKWHENIPENGVLCKDYSGIIKLIIASNMYDGWTNSGEFIALENLTPLTAQEWWDFAPWQGMDSAPIETELLASRNGIFSVVYFMQESQKKSYEKWLPLPVDL